MIISVLNQKGGSGKTTIATNLARAYQLSGKKTLLVDSDPQGSARDWNDANEGSLLPVVGLDRPTLPKDLDAIKDGYEVIIIDGAPQVARLSYVAAQVSDCIIIPVQPSPYDIWACVDLVELIFQHRTVRPDLKAGFVISRAVKRTKLKGEVGDALAEYDLPVLSAFTTQRQVYASSAMSGSTVLDEKSAKDAKEEILRIKEQVEVLLTSETYTSAASTLKVVSA